MLFYIVHQLCHQRIAIIGTGALHQTVGCIKSVVRLISVIVKKGFLRCRYPQIVSDTLIYHHFICVVYFINHSQMIKIADA